MAVTFLVQVITHGFQMSLGILLLAVLRRWGEDTMAESGRVKRRNLNIKNSCRTSVGQRKDLNAKSPFELCLPQDILILHTYMGSAFRGEKVGR